MSFYIEKIIVTGSGKTDSIIELSNGVNIIYGPSNTGKTYIVKCIDYMFGSEREPIDISTGYQYIKIIVRTQCGTITMSRKIGENKIEVSSNDNNVPSGKYATKASRTNYDKTINSVWLSLIGINDLHLVISNENYKKQILSWRTFSHMQENPEVEISVSSPEYAWIRLHGKAVFENNMAAKEMCIQNPIVKGQYGEATNPIFEVFYLDNAHGIIADFSGNPPYEF